MSQSTSRSPRYITTTINIPQNMVGYFIGRSGDNINNLREKSNARIEMSDDRTSESRLVFLTGTAEEVRMAEDMIQKLLLDFKPRRNMLIAVAVFILKDKSILLGRRLGEIGQGTFALPGGVLEWGEDFYECATREVKEETDLDIKHISILDVQNFVHEGTSNPPHVVTIIVKAFLSDPNQTPANPEPKKHENWAWFSWEELPRPLFKPLEILIDRGFSPFSCRQFGLAHLEEAEGSAENLLQRSGHSLLRDLKEAEGSADFKPHLEEAEGSADVHGMLSDFLKKTSQAGPAVEASMDATAPQKPSLKFLIYGRTGWIGGLLGNICEKQGIPFEYGEGRLEERSQLLSDIQNVKPTHVFNSAGVTGRPNVDWCESHKLETFRTKVVGTLTLADVCREKSLLVMNYATGCIFEYDDKHPEGSGIGFKEEDTPNFAGSFYSKTMALVEELLKEYENVCTLRVRMPISSDLPNPCNFITKISSYYNNKVVNIPNSMTVLDELLPISVEMAKRNLTGIWNFTNPGVVSHNEILEMYKEYIEPSFHWCNFTPEEQAKVIVAARSNNEMDASKLKNEFPELLSIKDSLINNEMDASKLKNEFPELLSIKDSLIKYVFEPNKKV